MSPFLCLWRYLPPGSVDCGGGTQSRSVTCQTAAGAVVADSSCPAASKPAASRACGEGVCVVGSWVRSNSQSPPLCDFVSYPTLTSHSISFTGAQGAPKYKFVVVSVACCAGFRAHTAQFCHVSVLVHPELNTSVCVWIRLPCALVCLEAVCSSWVLFSLQSTGSWGTCVSSTGCGVGTSSRNVNCQSATGTLLPDAECAGAGARPASVAACDAGACPYFMWQVGSWLLHHIFVFARGP